MSEKSWHLSRRTFLRGAGVAFALPWLESMAPRLSLGATAQAAPPVRMACLFFPNGAYPSAWTPTKTGADYDLPICLEPLAEVKKDVLVLTGLDKAKSHEGDGHYAKDANFLTGLHVNKTDGRDISAGGISMDQLAAEQIGSQTPLPSLELGVDPVDSGVDTNVGYTRLYACYVSWRAANIPVAKELNPRAVYDRMFASGDARKSSDDDRSLLDLALDDAKELRRKLGRHDQAKVDEYLESVRAVEKQIEFVSKPDDRRWKPTSPGALTPPEEVKRREYQKHVELMLDMTVLAFQTDQTRIASFMFANSVSNHNFGPYVEGVHGGHHEMSHHSKKPEKIEQYNRITRWHVAQYTRMLQKMRDIKEGPGTLLDHSLVLFGSGMSDGNRHDPADLPILLGGRASGAIAPGRHIASPHGTPLCNLYVSMLNAVGINVPRFGDSNGPLKGIDRAG